MSEFMVCPSCPREIEVSEEDADASLSEMLEHLTFRHAQYDRTAALKLLAKVKIR